MDGTLRIDFNLSNLTKDGKDYALKLYSNGNLAKFLELMLDRYIDEYIKDEGIKSQNKVEEAKSASSTSNDFTQMMNVLLDIKENILSMNDNLSNGMPQEQLADLFNKMQNSDIKQTASSSSQVSQNRDTVTEVKVGDINASCKSTVKKSGKMNMDKISKLKKLKKG